MRVAFVGIKRKYQEIEPGYRDSFNRYHLELPYYFSLPGNNVVITTVDYDDSPRLVGKGVLLCIKEENFKDHQFDVVVHWRKWLPEFYRPEAVNVINCQDHSFSPEWISSVWAAYAAKQLHGILCFPTWHKRNLVKETGLTESVLFDGVTLGVDTDVYYPTHDKDPYQMLWASDPGRGLDGAIRIALLLFQRDRRFKLHICVPDYAKLNLASRAQLNHPALVWHRNIDNGPKLWDLFNTTGIVPYTSTFREPSSRVHRQAMAAGSLVLYPPSMGSPSELIQSGITGFVSNPVTWADVILKQVETGQWKTIGKVAREYAVSENWQVQAERFTKLFEGILGERK